MSNQWRDIKGKRKSTSYHFGCGNMKQIWGVITWGQGLRFKGAGVLQLLDGGELGLIIIGLSDVEAWNNGEKKNLVLLIRLNDLADGKLTEVCLYE